MITMASQITSLTIVYSTVYSGTDEKWTSKLHVTGLCEGNSPVTGEFPSQRVSNEENASIWWHRHEIISEMGPWLILSVPSQLRPHRTWWMARLPQRQRIKYGIIASQTETILHICMVKKWKHILMLVFYSFKISGNYQMKNVVQVIILFISSCSDHQLFTLH